MAVFLMHVTGQKDALLRIVTCIGEMHSPEAFVAAKKAAFIREYRPEWTLCAARPERLYRSHLYALAEKADPDDEVLISGSFPVEGVMPCIDAGL